MSKFNVRTENERANETNEDETERSNAAELLTKIRNRHQKIKSEIMANQENTDMDQDETPRSNENESYSIRRLVPGNEENANLLTVPKSIRKTPNRRNRSAGNTVVGAVKRGVTYEDEATGHVNQGFESDTERQKTEEPAADLESEQKKPKPRRPRNKNRKPGQDAVNQTESESGQPATSFEDTLITAVIVHQSDRLRTDINIYHPIVKVHVLDLDMDGQYAKKSHKDRNALQYYENDNRKMDYISPITTTPFDFKANSSIIPKWEELVIFNERYNYLTQEHPNILLMFELLDSSNKSSEGGTDRKPSYTLQDSNVNWQRIAWAFLKVVGSDKSLNTEKKIRLQLYYGPARSARILDAGVPEIYNYYRSAHRIKYPSTLHVTVKAIMAPKRFVPGLRSVFFIENQEFYADLDALEREGPLSENENDTSRGNLSDNELMRQVDDKISGPNAPGLTLEEQNKRWLSRATVMWSRLPGQPCRIPNELALTLSTPRNGCYSVKFSTSGSFLACALVEDNNISPICIYSVPGGNYVRKFRGHFGLVYEIAWSKLDKYILTASSDATARVFQVESKAKEAFRILPHPSFIYSAKFHPNSLDIVVTCGYDKIVRVWSIESRKAHPQKYGLLCQELQGHMGYVNSISFAADGNNLYSADSTGRIFCWMTPLKDDPNTHTNAVKQWTLRQQVEVEEIRNQCINYIELHPNQRRLLVHLRDNQLKLVDLRIQSVVQRFKGAFNFNQNLKSTISPCGTFVFSSGADTKIYCWNMNSGEQVTTASINLNYLKPARDMNFHPFENMIALCSYDSHAPVYVFKYNPEKAAHELGDIRAHIPGSPPVKLPAPTIRVDASHLVDEQAISPRPTDLRPAEQDLKKKFTDDVAKFNDYQVDRWRRVHEQLDAVHPSTRGQTSSRSPRKQSEFMTHHNQYDPGSIIFSMGENNAKPEFKYRGPKEVQDVVISLYDYKAQRNDELDLVKGDEIVVLVKESENWWMGELVRNKRQGYFPANYVEEKSALSQHPAPVNPKPAKYSVNDLMTDFEKTYKKDALQSIVTKQPQAQTSKSNNSTNNSGANQSTLISENPSVDIINEAPTRDLPSSRRRNRNGGNVQRRPFAHVISAPNAQDEDDVDI